MHTGLEENYFSPSWQRKAPYSKNNTANTLRTQLIYSTQRGIFNWPCTNRKRFLIAAKRFVAVTYLQWMISSKTCSYFAEFTQMLSPSCPTNDNKLLQILRHIYQNKMYFIFTRIKLMNKKRLFMTQTNKIFKNHSYVLGYKSLIHELIF